MALYSGSSRDGWDPLHPDYYKTISSLIGDPEVRARTEQQMERIVRDADERRRARELQEREDMATHARTEPPQDALRFLPCSLALLRQQKQEEERAKQLQVAERERVKRQQKLEEERAKQLQVAEQERSRAQEKMRNAQREQLRMYEMERVKRERIKARDEKLREDRLRAERESLRLEEENARLKRLNDERERLRIEEERTILNAYNDEQERLRVEHESNLKRRNAEKEEAVAKMQRLYEDRERRRISQTAIRSQHYVPPTTVQHPPEKKWIAKKPRSQEEHWLWERHKDIVSAAIDAVASSSPKRSYSEFEKDSQSAPTSSSTPQRAKKPLNAFSKMVPKKYTNRPVDFTQWNSYLKQTLDARVHQGYACGEANWASLVTKTITSCIDLVILPHIRDKPHTETKINALHVLIEIATAVSYAPRSIASDSIRRSTLPDTLLDHMFRIADKMSASERESVQQEGAFLGKVRTLRYHPMVPWEGSTWNDLDEMLRVLRDPGPVDFRMIFNQISRSIRTIRSSATTATAVQRIINNDITSYVTPHTCFETKYNAMNVLADAGAIAMKEASRYGREPWVVMAEISASLLQLGKMLDGEQVSKIHSEMDSEPDLASPTFLNDFLERIDDDILNFKSRNNNLFIRDYGFKLTTCAKLQRLVDRKLEKKRAHGSDGLLAKILLLRLDSQCSDSRWVKTCGALDELLEVLVDGSAPLKCERYLWKVEAVLVTAAMEGSHPNDGKPAKGVRTMVDRTIARILKLAQRACIETKLNAFRILAKIGKEIVAWMYQTRPKWQLEVFQDHISEDSITDAMMAICDSIVKTGGVKALSDQDLLGITEQLDVLRAPVPEAFDGLEAILDVLRDPALLGSKDDKRMKTLTISKMKEDVIDLTDD